MISADVMCVKIEIKVSKKVNKSIVLAERPGWQPNIAAPSWFRVGVGVDVNKTDFFKDFFLV